MKIWLKNMGLLFVILLLQSCVVHSNFPFICFLKKCRQTKSEARHLSSQINRNRTPKLKGTMIGRNMSAKNIKIKPKNKIKQTHPGYEVNTNSIRKESGTKQNSEIFNFTKIK